VYDKKFFIPNPLCNRGHGSQPTPGTSSKANTYPLTNEDPNKGWVGYTVYIEWTIMMAIEKGEGLRWIWVQVFLEAQQEHLLTQTTMFEIPVFQTQIGNSPRGLGAGTRRG
jgi:hypothetical protein